MYWLREWTCKLTSRFPGHTANLWQGDKLIVYGGENEHRTYLSDVIVFDLKTAHWTSPELHGPAPRGRARHASVIHDNKLYIMGGITGHEGYVLDDICYLNLKTWTWSRVWRFVPRFDHTAWLWSNKIWVFGGLGVEMERTGEVWWLDPCENPTLQTSAMTYGRGMTADGSSGGPSRGRNAFLNPGSGSGSSSGHAANSSSIQSSSPLLNNRNPPAAPGLVSSLRFRPSPNVPVQAVGTHFHFLSSGSLLDFTTPASVNTGYETGLNALDLQSLRWEKLADGIDLFNPDYRWHYCTVNDDATHAWLLGCPADTNGRGGEEYLSDFLPIDLAKLGLVGNSLTPEPGTERSLLPASDTTQDSPYAGIGADFATLFDQAPESGSNTDFVITALKDEESNEDDDDDDASVVEYPTEGGLPATAESKPIHVHTLILLARWPHFGRLYRSQMREFHTRKMHIPEPYRVVRAFLLYLYTDSIAEVRRENGDSSPNLADVGGMLTMASLYDMPRLHLLCLHRLAKELNVDHAAFIWERACAAGADWLKKRAATFCMTHWGRVVRSEGFRQLPRRNLMDLCAEIDQEGRVVGGEELEAVGGLDGSRLGFEGSTPTSRSRRKRSLMNSPGWEEDTDTVEGSDEGMELS
jgi:hypothetical protein